MSIDAFLVLIAAASIAATMRAGHEAGGVPPVVSLTPISRPRRGGPR
jgi:hypothetical protein